MNEEQTSQLRSNSPSIGVSSDFRIDWSTFVRIVLDVTTEAYMAMNADGVAQRDWEEESFSVSLGEKYLRPRAYEYQLIIVCEAPVFTTEMESGNETPKRARLIDIKIFGSWERDYHKIYFTWECKRIADKTLEPAYAPLVAEYVSEGIQRFIDRVYSPDVSTAGMLGYVLVGEPSNIVPQINQSMLESRRRRRLTKEDHLKLDSAIGDLEDVYLSSHKRSESDSIQLHHLFLTFDFE